MNTDLDIKANNDFEKYSFKLLNNLIFGKSMENARKHRCIELPATDKKKKIFGIRANLSYSKVISNRNEKNSNSHNELVYLGMSILELSKIVIYEFWYDYVKPKYGEKANLCCLDTDIFIVYIKLDDIYKDIADVETRFDTSNDDLIRTLLKGKNKKVIG